MNEGKPRPTINPVDGGDEVPEGWKDMVTEVADMLREIMDERGMPYDPELSDLELIVNLGATREQPTHSGAADPRAPLSDV